MKRNFLHTKTKSPKTRLSRVEALEERQLLSATPYENYASETAPETSLVAPPLVDSEILVQTEAVEASETPLVTTGTTWVVTSVSDNYTPGTLRYVIGNSQDGDTITFAQSLKGKTITLTGTQLSITSDVTIDASSIWDSTNNKPGVMIDADWNSRVFHISADAELIGLNISYGYTSDSGGAIYANGDIKLTNCWICSGWAEGNGGGIFVYYGTTSLTNCRVMMNEAKKGAGVAVDDFAMLVANQTEFTYNDATSNGGGIYAVEATVELSSCAIKSNTSDEHGGGIYANKSDTSMVDCVVCNNEADARGGGVRITGGEAYLENCLIAQNSANYGGGICNSGDTDIYSCTIACNEATSGGGGVYVREESDAWIHNSIVALNSAGTDADVRIQNSDNYAPKIRVDCSLSSFSRWSNSGSGTYYIYNSSLPLFFDLNNDDYHLVPGSQALNRGDNDIVLDTDLDGKPRIINGTTDLGCYEYAGPLSTPIVTYSTTQSAVVVNIGAVDSAEKYVVQYATNSSFTSAKTKTYSSAGVKTISGLTSGTTYYVRVKATASEWFGDSGWATFSATTSAASLAAPTLSATATTVSSVTLSIGSVANATSYVLQYATNSSFTSATSKTYTSAGSKTITGLTASTTYYFRVKATAANYADSAYKSVSAKTQAAGPPLATPAISLSGTNSAIVVKIDAVTGAEKYVVDYSTSSTFANVTTKIYSSAGVKTISGLTAGKWYYVRVKATATNRQDSPVVTGKAYTGGRVAMPAVSASAVKTAIVLNIKEVANGDKYVVEYGLKSDYSDAASKTFSVGVRTLSGLTFGKTYYIRVKATSAVANDSMWNELTFAAGQLATPSASVMKTDSSSINVKCWNSASASGFEVKYATKADFSDGKTVKQTGTGTITIPNLNPQTKYYLSARALGDNISRVNSNWTTTFTATTKAATPLPTPAASSVSSTKTAVVVNFSAVPNATGYVLQYGTDSAFGTYSTKNYTSAGSKTISGLSQGTRYYFRLKATAAGYGDSPWTKFNIRTQGGPDAPTVTASVTKSAVVLNIGAVANASSYVVQYSTKSTFATTTEKTYTNAGAKTISGLNSGTTYYFRVKAVSDTIGESEWTTVTAKTKTEVATTGSATGFEDYLDEEFEEFWDLLG